MSIEKRECVRVSEYNAIFLCFLCDDYEWMWRNKCLFLLLFFLFPSSQHKHSSFFVLLWKEKEEANNPNIWHFRKMFVVSLMSAYCDVRVSFYVDFRFFDLQIFSVYFGTFMPHGRLIHRSMFVCLCCYGVNFVVDFDPINVRTSKRWVCCPVLTVVFHMIAK